MGFNQSTSELAQKRINGEITDEEYVEAWLSLLDEALANGSLPNNYYSVSRSFHETVGEYPYLIAGNDELKELMIRLSDGEIELFKKHGKDVSQMQKLHDDVIEKIKEL